MEIDLYQLLQKYGQLYSMELGIDLRKDPFRWLLASILFGARISTTIAKKTYQVYEEAGLNTPEKIALADRGQLIKVHGRGGYARYDGITADYMQGVARKLLQDYGGDVRELDKKSRSPVELEERLLQFVGIGPVTMRIFLRELRGVWKNADPEPTKIEIMAAIKLGIVESDEGILEKLKGFWQEKRIEGYDFRNFEAALVRVGLKLRRGKVSFYDY